MEKKRLKHVLKHLKRHEDTMAMYCYMGGNDYWRQI